MREEWRPVPGSKGQYEVSSLGRVRNARTGRIRKIYTCVSGCRVVSLGGWLNKTYTVGQLVAAAWYPDKKGRVTHKNKNKGDDRPENLYVEESYE